MATYYRWRKSSVTYPLVEIGRSSSWTETGYYPLYDDEVVEVLTCGLENLTITASAIIMNSPKSYSFGNNDSTGHYSGYTICRPWQSAKPTAYSTPYVYKSNQGNTRYNLFTEDTVTVTNPSNYPSAQIIKYGPGSPVAGDFIEYVYSTSPSAYPQDGISGNYFYSDRTAITVSPPSSISVSPNPPKGGSNVSVSWGAASSGGGAISNYELSKRLDGGSWTVVGTYGSSTRAASVSVPAGTETIAFRVRAKDENAFGPITRPAAPTR